MRQHEGKYKSGQKGNKPRKIFIWSDYVPKCIKPENVPTPIWCEIMLQFGIQRSDGGAAVNGVNLVYVPRIQMNLWMVRIKTNT